MPFQPGNQEAKKGKRAKLYRDALTLELAAAGDDFKEMREIARKHIDLAKTGDMQAIKEFADRIEGKVPQGIIGGDEDDPAVNVITRIEIVAGGGNNGQS